MKPTKLSPLLLLAAIAGGLHAADFAETLALAETGDSVAQIQTAKAYATGTGVGKNMAEAAKWFEKAASQGNVAAQWKLGTLYLGGRGLKRDSTTAALWIGQAAEQGHADAQLQLARMHLSGAGVPKDDVEAYKWANLSANQDNHAAVKLVAFLEARMDAAQLARARAKITEYESRAKPEHEETGVPLVAPALDEQSIRPGPGAEREAEDPQPEQPTTPAADDE